jgi:hypothetical protein
MRWWNNIRCVAIHAFVFAYDSLLRRYAFDPVRDMYLVRAEMQTVLDLMDHSIGDVSRAIVTFRRSLDMSRTQRCNSIVSYEYRKFPASLTHIYHLVVVTMTFHSFAWKEHFVVFTNVLYQTATDIVLNACPLTFADGNG